MLRSRGLSLSPHTVIVAVRDSMVTLEGRLERLSDIPRVIQAVWRVDGVVTPER